MAEASGKKYGSIGSDEHQGQCTLYSAMLSTRYGIQPPMSSLFYMAEMGSTVAIEPSMEHPLFLFTPTIFFSTLTRPLARMDMSHLIATRNKIAADLRIASATQARERTIVPLYNS